MATAVRRPVFFESAADFKQWLEQNSLREQELIVGFHKVGSGKPSMSWSESVDEALCLGWIDGVRKRVDDHSYQIRFTPRKPGSVWSTVNIAKVEALTALGRMRPAGVEAFARRTARKSSVYSYEQVGALELSPPELRAFKEHKAAWQHFGSVAPSYRKVMVFWVVSSKQQATRERRLAQLIDACANGRKLLK